MSTTRLLRLAAAASLAAVSAAQTPPELGAIGWQRDLATARQLARERRQPILLLFQEVPGWRTCRDFGAHVLSHPLLVEAAEELFVPLAIRNNTDGDADAAVRQRFDEKAWNNPVVRFVGADLGELAPKLHDDWTVAALARGMVAALGERRGNERGGKASAWLDLLAAAEVARRRGLERAVFSQAWFWVGEAEFGLLDGVFATRAGWLDRHEVTEVWFDPRALAFADLLAHGRRADCVRQVWTTTAAQLDAAREAVGDAARPLEADPRPDADPKHYLARTPYRHLPMTAAQAARCNAALAPGSEADPDRWLSPRQLALLAKVRADGERDWPNAVGVPITTAWARLRD